MGQLRNIHANGTLTWEETAAADVDTDASGDVTLTFSDIREIPSKAAVLAQAEGGYVCNVQSISGNQVTVRVYEGVGGTSAGELPSSDSGTDVTAVNAFAFGVR